MKYNLTLNLKAFYEVAPKSDIKDAYILDYLVWICASKAGGIVKKRVVKRGKELTWVNYSHLLNELPLLKIKDKAAITRRIEQLRLDGFIDTYFSKEAGNKKYVRLEPLVDKLFSSTIASKQQGIDTEQQGYGHRSTYNSISNNNTRDNKEKLKIKRKETDTDQFLVEKLEVKNPVKPETIDNTRAKLKKEGVLRA